MDIKIENTTHQQGFTLVMVMAIMAIVAIMVVAGAKMSNTELRVSANDADRKFAFSTAEQALVEAEEATAKTVIRIVADENISGTSEELSTLPGFTTNCGSGVGQGLCLPLAVNASVSASTQLNTASPWNMAGVFPASEDKSKDDNLKSVKIGNDKSHQGSYRNPRYISEFLGRTKNGICRLRVTVRSWGKNPNTVVTVQSYIEVNCQ